MHGAPGSGIFVLCKLYYNKICNAHFHGELYFFLDQYDPASLCSRNFVTVVPQPARLEIISHQCTNAIAHILRNGMCAGIRVFVAFPFFTTDFTGISWIYSPLLPAPCHNSQPLPISASNDIPTILKKRHHKPSTFHFH